MEKNFSLKNILRTITDSKALKWIFEVSKKQHLYIVLIAVMNILMAGSAVAISYMLRFVVNSATNSRLSVEERFEGVAFWGAFFVGIVLLQILIQLIDKHLVFRASARLTIDMRTRIYSALLHKDYAKVTRYHTGEMLNRINNDVGAVTGAITGIIPTLSYTMAKLVGILIVLISIDPLFALMFFAVGIFVFVVSSFFKKKMKSYHNQIMETDGKVRSFMQETLLSLLVVKVFSAEKKVVETASGLQEINYKRKAKRNIVSLVTHSSFNLAFRAAYLFGLFYCSVKIIEGDSVITYGVLSQVLSLINQISVPINSLTSILPTYYSAIGSAERIMEFEEIEDEVEVNDADISIEKLYKNLESIEFENITFKYDRDLIFDNTSLSINKCDLVVMTGISGIGKSTLLKLLLGVFSIESGSIYLKMKDGSKLTIDRNLRSLFSYVPQGNFLLSGTLRENITFINTDATEEEIWKAVEFACADFIRDLPQGLDTVIGEKGLGLSEGQVQRVAIARAILSGSPIILLDEATSALDERTELKLLENIKTLSDKTCILISHKKAANDVCNKEVRIVEGKIMVYDLNENI
ncbi:MAG: ABC transporter ATP-binding protein [Ruminococcaceae bacterium]|nr:ABC transporter ATP-binding protein [Oscillospiraceae bacterium]